jgi:hypothetical protein
MHSAGLYGCHHSAAQQCRAHSRHRISCEAAAGAAPVVTLKRFADAQQTDVVTERKAADVAVLGSSTAAVLAAYTIAKSGRKVGPVRRTIVCLCGMYAHI